MAPLAVAAPARVRSVDTRRPSGIRHGRWAIGIVLVLLAIYAPTAARAKANQDVVGASVEGWRIATTGAPWLDGLRPESVPHVGSVHMWTPVGRDGHEVVSRSPGVVAAATAAYFVARPGGSPSSFGLVPEGLGAALLAAIAVGLLYLTIAPRTGPPAGLAASAAFALATPMWSVDANSLWSHAITVLGIAGMGWAASRERWLLVGIFGGIAIWGRLHTALIVALVGLGVAVVRRKPSIAAQVAATSGASLGLACVWTHWLYGTWSPAGGYGMGRTGDILQTSVIAPGLWSHLANQLGLWLSPDRGFVIWTPVVVLLLPALVRGWRQLPDWSRFLLVGGIAYTLVQGQLDFFMGGDGFYGYRLTLELLTASAPALILSAHEVGRVARRLIGPVVALQFAAISVGAVSEGFFLTRDRAWHDNSLALALRTAPSLWIWLLLCLVIGTLVARVWRDRAGRRPTPAA